jgi:hypothetical protein
MSSAWGLLIQSARGIASNEKALIPCGGMISSSAITDNVFFPIGTESSKTSDPSGLKFRNAACLASHYVAVNYYNWYYLLSSDTAPFICPPGLLVASLAG